MGLCRLFSEARPQNLAFSLILAAFLKKSGAKNFTSIGFARVFLCGKTSKPLLTLFYYACAAWRRRLVPPTAFLLLYFFNCDKSNKKTPASSGVFLFILFIIICS